MNDIDDLREAWNTLDTCFDRPEKYISEALDPVVKFRSYKAFDNGAIREFCSILRAAMMGARKAGLLNRLINDQTLPGILAKMPPADWCQWAKERPAWMREAIEKAFWNFVDQKWRDALNVAAAELPTWGAGSGGRPTPQEGGKKGGAAEATKLAKAAVQVTGVDGEQRRQGDGGRMCVFKEVMGCPGTHPPWHCKVFGKLPAREREKIIKDNRLCPFCLLHDKDRPCGAKQKPVACTASNCKGRYIQKLHDFLKDVFREDSQVHVVHGDDRWEESEEAWELGEEEMMIIGKIRQEDDCSWQDASKSWLGQDEEVTTGVYQVGTCQSADKVPLEAEGAVKHPPAGHWEEEEVMEDEWQAPGPGDLLIEGEEGEYFLELLMREVLPGKPKTDQPAGGEEDPKSKTALARRKVKKKNKKKDFKGNKVAIEDGVQKEEESTVSPTDKQMKQAAPDLLINPEAKGRGLINDDRTATEPRSRSTTTARGECSGQEKPDS